jgi:hypothetical protein
MLVTEREELDHCPDCSLPLEIAAVSLRFFRKPAMLSVCPNCGLMRTDGKARLTIRDRLDALDKKLAIEASRLLPLGEPKAFGRLGDCSPRAHGVGLKSECENGRGLAIVGQRRRASPT